MKHFKIMTALVLGIAVSGCATIETGGTDLPFDSSARSFAATSDANAVSAREDRLPSYRVQDVNVSVPQHLEVSEANVFYPSGDIVWHGDPFGNRHEQVAALFETAAARSASQLNGQVPVVVDLEVLRFHSVTPKTRYTVGGVHSIRYQITIRHARTGEVLHAPKVVEADLKAFGGQRAINAEMAGQTQKVRVVDHLSRVLWSDIAHPTAAAPVALTQLSDTR